MKKSMFLILFSCLSSMIAICIAGYAQGQRSQQVPSKEEMEEAKKEEAKKNAIDLRPILNGKRLQEGLNKVYSYDSGTQIFAKVKRGQIVEWVALDGEGKRLTTTTMERQKGTKKGGDPPMGVTCKFCHVEFEKNAAGFTVPVAKCENVPCPGKVVIF